MPPIPPPRSGRAHPAPGRARLLRWAAILYGLLALAALAWNGWAGRPWAYLDAASAAAGIRWGRDLAVGLACAAAAIAASHLLTTRTRWGAALARELAEALGPLTLADCAVLAALSGFAEEMFFRGALQPRIGWLAASAVFGLAHYPPRRSLLPWTGFALIAGAMLGALFAATGNLAAPIAAHVAINAVNLYRLTRSIHR
ncbi:MAG TPA: CPBP family intramembrane glutamic endopeptidase [Myxococcota bacterium]|nr:CPBP family intramembrane glutamic endopeptidase [Myxococcota bacterium]